MKDFDMGKGHIVGMRCTLVIEGILKISASSKDLEVTISNCIGKDRF